MSKAILKKKNIVGALTLHDSKTYFKAIVIRTVWCIRMDEINGAEWSTRNRPTHIWPSEFSTKTPKQSNEGKESPSANVAGITRYL